MCVLRVAAALAACVIAVCPDAPALDRSLDVRQYVHADRGLNRWHDGGMTMFLTESGLPDATTGSFYKDAAGCLCHERVVWNKHATVLAFTLTPASYESWWFRGLVAAAACGGLALAYASHMRAVRRRFAEEARAAARLRASEARFRAFVDFASDALIIHGDGGVIVDVNEQACRALGYTREELIGGTPLDFDVELTPDRLRRLAEQVRSGETLTLETRHRRKDGTVFPVEVRVRGFYQGPDWIAIALSRDISERKQIEQERRTADASKFEAALEARVLERTRIARDLHDTLVQSFQGLLLRFESVLKLLPARPDEARTRLVAALDRATEAVTEARDAVQGLRSAAQGERDLLDALRSVADEFTGIGGQPTAFSMEVVGARRAKNALVRDEITRVVGEALRNAFRHAHATRISVRITYGDQQFQLEVRDDGIGVDLSAGLLPRPGHFGLRNMRERAETIGGRLDIQSAPGSGTTIELRVPASVAYTATVALGTPERSPAE